MKKQYIQPTTDLVNVRLNGTVLQTKVTIQGASYETDELGTNQTAFEPEDDFEGINKPQSLWDD